MPQTTALQIRVSPDLSAKVKAQALRQKISANRLVIDALYLYLKTEKEREWREGFEATGSNPDCNNVDFMLPAAREVEFGS